MELVNIGKFIAELRKEQNLTQEQLGEKVGVTNKTVSRWETGAYMPPADVLLSMSNLFSVSVNEILSGKRLTEEEYKAAAEENLCQTVKESSFSLKDRIDFYKKKWQKEHVAVMWIFNICIFALLIPAFFFKTPAFGAGSLLLLAFSRLWRYNAMMAFVEKYAFDGSGKK